MTPTHKLPPHLGEWPCRSLHSAASNELGQMLTLVEYTTHQGTHQIYVNWNDLTRIVAPEPTTPYVVGADGYVYKLMPGCEPGTTERLWAEASPGYTRHVTWGALTIAWEEEEKTHPIVPLVPADAWLDNAPELPFELADVGSSGTSHALSVDARSEKSGRGWGPHPIRVLLGSNLAGLEADQAEEFAYALLRAVHETRAKDQR